MGCGYELNNLKVRLLNPVHLPLMHKVYRCNLGSLKVGTLNPVRERTKYMDMN